MKGEVEPRNITKGKRSRKGREKDKAATIATRYREEEKRGKVEEKAKKKEVDG